MHIAYKNFEVIQARVRQAIKRREPGLSLTADFPLSKGLHLDLFGTDKEGREHVFEIKGRPLHRVDVGQLLDLATRVSKKWPHAVFHVVCTRAAPFDGVLTREGIDVITFGDLHLPDPKPVKRQAQGLSPTEQRVYFLLMRRGKTVVSTSEFARTVGVSPSRARNLLSDLATRGVAVRLGRGRYAILPAEVVYGRKTYTVDPLLVLGPLLGGSRYYVAYATAAELHGMATQVAYATYVVVEKQRRSISLGRGEIRFIKGSHFFGIEKRRYLEGTVPVSDLERTVVDSFDRADLVGGIREAARIFADSLDRLRPRTLARYAQAMNNKALLQRIGFVADELRKLGYPKCASISAALRSRVDGFVYRLDSRKKPSHRVSRKWRIDENIDVVRELGARTKRP